MAVKKKLPILTLTPEQENEANHKIKRFMEDRFELDLGSFEAAEILELFTREIAPHYYNRAIFRCADAPQREVRKHRKRPVGAREKN